MSQIKTIEKKPSFQEIVSQFLIVTGVTLTSLFVFSFLGILIALPFYDISLTELTDPEYQDINAQLVGALKVSQFFATIGTFLFPALIIPYLLKAKPDRFLGITTPSKYSPFLLIFALFFFLYPFLEWLIQFNQNLTFPEFLSQLENWFKQQEKQIQVLTEKFLVMENTGEFLINVLIMAVTAAIAEEFFFRGLLQRLFYQWSGRVHTSILITAILFSALHIQFYGFLPRLFLGLTFGYLLYWTGNIWAPVFAHFLNNFATVLMSYMSQKGFIESGAGQVSEFPVFTILLSLLLSLLVLFYIKRLSSKKRERTKSGRANWEKIYITKEPHKAEILLGKLENKGIQAVKMNKKDSAYTVFGEIEIYVNATQVDQAREVILNHNQ